MTHDSRSTERIAWLTLPEGVDTAELFNAALAQNVAFVPGDAFYATGIEGAHHARLNFSNAQPDKIREGIRRLAVAVKELLAEGDLVTP